MLGEHVGIQSIFDAGRCALFLIDLVLRIMNPKFGSAILNRRHKTNRRDETKSSVSRHDL